MDKRNYTIIAETNQGDQILAEQFIGTWWEAALKAHHLADAWVDRTGGEITGIVLESHGVVGQTPALDIPSIRSRQ